MTPETEKAYRAWRIAADTVDMRANRATTPGQEERKQERIRRLKARYERLLCEEKGIPYHAD